MYCKWIVCREKKREHVRDEFPAERQALELILSQNIIKLQTTDNQVQITTQSKTKCF